jgi:hypothetical protein
VLGKNRSSNFGEFCEFVEVKSNDLQNRFRGENDQKEFFNIRERLLSPSELASQDTGRVTG